MAYSKKNKAYAIKRAVYVSVILLCIAAITVSVFMLHSSTASVEAVYSGDHSKESKNMTVAAVRVKQKMKQGELIDVGKVEMTEIPADLAPKGRISSISKLNNVRLKRDIAEMELLNELDIMPETAAFDEEDRLIEHNFAEGAVPAAVSQGSAIDIRLFVKGGEDMVVISKAFVVSRSGSLLAFYLDAEEQEYIKEAASTGTLFAVMYIDTSQAASKVTYIPQYEKRISNTSLKE